MEINNKISLYEKMSVFLVGALGFLMPTFFLATTTEFFEFNKLALLTIATVLLILLLGAKVMSGSSINIIKTRIDFPLILFVIVFALSTVFSIDKTSSIWGSQGRWYPSLFGLIVLVTFYYMAASNFRTADHIKLALHGLIMGGTVCSLVAILSYFQIYVGSADYFKIPAFSLTGSAATTMLLAAICVALSIFFTYKSDSIPTKLVFITATVINFAYVATVGKTLGGVLLAVAVVGTIIALDAKRVMEDRFTTMFLTTSLLVIIMLNVFPATKDLITNKAYTYEVTLPIKESWVVSASSIQDYPLLATGPSTFALNFSRYRPLSLNASPLWNIRFDKPQSEIFNTIATLGIIGFAAFLFLLARIFKFAQNNYKADETTGLARILAVAVILAGSAYLFTYATVLNTFILFFLLLLLSAAHIHLVRNTNHAEMITLSFASFTASTTTIGDTSAVRREYANLVAVTPLVLVSLFGAYLYARTYLGEYYMRSAITAAGANQAVQAYDLQGKAININPKRDTYHTTYAQTNLALANGLAANQNLSDQDKQTIQNLVGQAIRSSRISTEVVNPTNVVNWETRALIYRMLINIADNATDWAIASYNSAINLEPSNPALRVDLGGVYYIKGDYLAAANMFRQATSLKADYANAHYNFAQALINLNDLENAKQELELTKTLVSPDSNDYKLVEEQIAALTARQAEVAGAATENKPSIEQITAATNQPAQAQQQPLTTPTQEQQGENLNPAVLPTENNQQPTPAVTPTVQPTPGQ